MAQELLSYSLGMKLRLKACVSTILLILLMIPPVGVAQNLPSFNSSFDELETWMRAPERTNAEIDESSDILAKKYLADERYQEAIWTLRFAKKFEDADVIEKDLIEKMSKNQMQFLEVLGGVSGSDKVKLGEGELYGVFKSKNYYYVNEIAAYRLDRLLNLNIVPLTIARKHPTNNEGSLQYFIRDKRDNPIYHGQDFEFRSYPYPENQKKMWLLDYLLDNHDRHGLNWFKRFGDQTVAIDYGYALGRELGRDSIRGAIMQPELLPDGDLLEKLKQLSPSDFRGLNIDASFILNRRNKIIEEIKKHDPVNICESLLAV